MTAKDGGRPASDEAVGRILYALFGIDLVTWVWIASIWLMIEACGIPRWVTFLIAGLVFLLLLAVSVKARDPRIRRVTGVCLPVYGDVVRWRRRRARRRGNDWLRETGLVHDADPARRTNYRCWLWADRVEIRRLTAVGVTEDRLRSAVTDSLVSWDKADFELIRLGNSSWDIPLYDQDRLEALRIDRRLDSLPECLGEMGHLCVRIGRSLDDDVWLDFANVSGILLSGLPGAGKTSAMQIIVSALLSRPDLVDVIILDGKGGGDWAWASEYCKSFTNDDGYDHALQILHKVQDRMRDTLTHSRGRYGVSNMWDVFGRPACADKPLVVVVDELQNWTAPPVLDKDTKANRDEFVGLLTDLVKKGRAVGFCVMCATQKPTTDSIPSGLRDVMSRRFAFRVSTLDMARACLGDIQKGAPSPLSIAFSDRGMCVSATETGDTEFIRFDYLPESDIEMMLEHIRRPRNRSSSQ